MVMPLVTDSTGKKFGKTEGNALWLDKNKTSSYEMYQYLVNLEDNMIIEYLKKLTFLSKEEIEELEKKNIEHPELREAHKALAKEIISDIHSEEDYENAVKISECLFKGDINHLKENELEDAFRGAPSFEVKLGLPLIDVLVNNKIAVSKREAREFLANGSITVNGEKENDENKIIDKDSLMFNKYLIIRKGKKKYFIGM